MASISPLSVLRGILLRMILILITMTSFSRGIRGGVAIRRPEYHANEIVIQNDIGRPIYSQIYEGWEIDVSLEYGIRPYAPLSSRSVNANEVYSSKFASEVQIA